MKSELDGLGNLGQKWTNVFKQTTNSQFVVKQISIVEPLVKLQQYPETELLTLQRQAKDFEGKIEGSIASKLRFETSILEVQDQIASAKQTYRTNFKEKYITNTNKKWW